MPKDFYDNYLQNLNKKLTPADWSRPYDWYLRGWLPRDREKKILELGCGEGHLLAAFKSWGYRQVRGIDLRPEAAAYCQTQGLEVEVADARDYLKGHTGEFQLIIALDVLEHLTPQEGLELLEDANGAIVPGGAVILQVPNLASPFGGAVFFGDLTHRTGFTETSIRQLLSLAGFSQVEIRPAGPGLWSVKAAIRFLLWHMVKPLVRLWHIIECGSAGPSVLTRVLLARGRVTPEMEASCR
jgi:2-polyprenyl-3-methyl-5-hydroxy-6-metoxy-1,4-benzoquinol methylase